MRNGTKMIVSSGCGSYVAYFLEWLDDTHIKALNRFGGFCVVDQADIEQFFV